MTHQIIIDCETGEEIFAEFAPAPPTNADIAARWTAIRIQRNKLLADCDWTQLADAPVDAAAWTPYRQALRDVTAQPDPFAIVWPESPSL